MTDLFSACKNAVQSFDGAIACGVFSIAGGAPLAYHLGDSTKQKECQDFVALALELLGQGGQQDLSAFSKDKTSSTEHGEVHLAGAIYGYARLLPVHNVVVVLMAHPTNNVGVGWATLSIASTRISSFL